MANVTLSAEDSIATITLDRPPANSYDLAMMTEFSAAVDEAIGGDIRVVILRSASEKFFCAGADIKRFLEGDVEANMEMIRTSQAAFKRMAAANQVFIAHINGHALGGGLELALACDLRYADAGSYRLGTPEVTLGLLPGNGGTQRLTRLIGPSRALDLLITGRTYSADDAVQMGLVSAVFAPDEAHERTRAIAEQFAIGPRAGDRRDQALCTRGRPAVARRRPRARGERDGAAVQIQGRGRGPDRIRREAQAGVRRSMSAGTTHELRRGPFIDGAPQPPDGDTLTITNPGTGELVGHVSSCDGETVDVAVHSAAAAGGEWARRSYADRGEVLHACATAFEAHVDELVPLLVAEQGKTTREARIELRKAAETLDHYVGPGQGGPGGVRRRARPWRRGPRRAPAAGSRRRDRAVELPDHAAVQQAGAGAAVRQHGRRQAGRHDPVHDPPPGRDPDRGRAASGAC